MAVKQLDSPCWVSLSYNLADPNHYASGTTDALPAEDSTRQLADRCWLVICDRPDCGETLGDDEHDEVHWETEDQARKVAAWDEWEIAPDGTVTCRECRGE